MFKTDINSKNLCQMHWPQKKKKKKQNPKQGKKEKKKTKKKAWQLNRSFG